MIIITSFMIHSRIQYYLFNGYILTVLLSSIHKLDYDRELSMCSF